MTLFKLKELCEKATEGPWTACNGGKCSCKMVSCAEFPIATITQVDRLRAELRKLKGRE